MIMFQGYHDNMNKLKSRNCKIESGKPYERNDEAKLREIGCRSYHYPLDVLGYYMMSNNREVAASNEDESGERNDAKTCAKKLTVGAEIGIPGLMKVRFEYSREHNNE